jgi:DNA repair protein RadC
MVAVRHAAVRTGQTRGARGPAPAFAFTVSRRLASVVSRPYHEVSRGTLDTTLVHPREVFKAAILANASAIVVAHVHPSGDPTPSGDDLHLTRQLTAAGTLLGIEVLDHIIVGDGRHVSFREIGHL